MVSGVDENNDNNNLESVQVVVVVAAVFAVVRAGEERTPTQHPPVPTTRLLLPNAQGRFWSLKNDDSNSVDTGLSNKNGVAVAVAVPGAVVVVAQGSFPTNRAAVLLLFLLFW